MNEIRVKKASRAALLDELVLALNLADPTLLDVGTGGEEVVVRFPDGLDRGTIATVVQAHNAATVDAREETARQARRQVRQTIVAYPDLVTPTNAQTVAAVKALCLAVRELFRAE